MSATVSAEALRELHRIHTQLADLRGRLERGPKQVAARNAAVKQLAADVASAEDLVKQTRMAADKKQVDIQAQEERIRNWETQLNSAKSNKEYDTLREQIAAARMAASVLEDETLELLGRVDECVAEVGRAKEALANGEAEAAKVAETVAKNSERLRGEITRLEGDLATAEKALTGDFMADYQRVIRVKGPDGLAPFEDGVCQGCGQSITLQMQSELRACKPTFCKSCGVLLYLPEQG
ncbi:MAG: phospholipase [Planctomycetota bacterium]